MQAVIRHRIRGLLLLAITALSLDTAYAQGTFAAGASPAQPRIVGGTPVTDLRYPFMTAVFADLDGSGTFFQTCGGSLVGSRWVLTAAHCVVDATTGAVKEASALGLQLSALDISTPEGVFRGVSSVHVHPDYAINTFQYDMALLELDAAVDVSPVALAAVGEDDPVNEETAVVSGWGLTSEMGSPSAQLLQVELPIVSHPECLPFYTEVLVREIHICAGGVPEGGRSACFGDSGGPLMFLRDGAYLQIGVVSFGVSCELPGIPGVYARVSGFTDWVQSLVPDVLIIGGSGPDADVPEDVVFLEPDVVLSDSLLLGDAQLYEVSPGGSVQLQTLSGNADLYVVVGTGFDQDDIVCSSLNTVGIDSCDVPDTGQRVFVIVYAAVDSDYELSYTVANGAPAVPGTGPVALPPGSVAIGNTDEGEVIYYDVTGASRVELQTLTGDADLAIYEGADAASAQLTCTSTLESGTDRCEVSGAAAISLAAVTGYIASSYRIESVVSTTADGPIALPPGSVASGDVAAENTVAYDVTGASRVEVQTLTGDADLLIYEGPGLDALELTCSSVESTALDACSVLGTSAVSVALVYGFVDSSYQVSSLIDDMPVVNAPDITLISLPPGSVDNARVEEGEFVFYDVTGARRADLQTLSGDADLVILEGPDVASLTITCLSEEIEALDSCELSGTAPLGVAAVFGIAGSSYQIESVSTDPIESTDPAITDDPDTTQDPDIADNPFETVQASDDGRVASSGGGGAFTGQGLWLLALALVAREWHRRRRVHVFDAGGARMVA